MSLLHRSVREGIAAAIRSNNGRHLQGEAAGEAEAEETATTPGLLLIRGRRWEQPLNLHSVQHLVHFLRETEDNNSTAAAAAAAAADTETDTTIAASVPASAAATSHSSPVDPVVGVVTHLKLHAVTIYNRHGELDVLHDYLMSPTTIKKHLAKVTIMGCTLGRTADDVERLLSAFYPVNNSNSSTSSGSIVHLDFWRLSHLHGEALGRCLSQILHNNRTLQRLECWGCPLLGAAGVAALQTALQSSNRDDDSNISLMELNLSGCGVGDAGLTGLATAIADNPHSSLQVLNLSGANQITIQGMETGIIKLATCERLRKIDFGHDVLVTVLRHATHSWQLARVLCSSNLYLQKLVGITHAAFPDCRPVVTAILGILSRNKLLAPQPAPPGEGEQATGGGGELLDSNSGIWSVALAKFARQGRREDNDIHSPATCIFQILQRRPFLVPQVQRRLQEQAQSPPPVSRSVAVMIPPPPMAAARQEEDNHPNGSDSAAIGNDLPRKRARLE
jgi:Leucine Rich repeat